MGDVGNEMIDTINDVILELEEADIEEEQRQAAAPAAAGEAQQASDTDDCDAPALGGASSSSALNDCAQQASAAGELADPMPAAPPIVQEPPPAEPVPENFLGMYAFRSGGSSGIVASIYDPSKDLGDRPLTSVRDVRTRIGVLHRVGRGLKLTCNAHRWCVCWVTSRTQTPEQVEHMLFEWLHKVTAAGGAADSATHTEQARDVKRRCGMRVS